MRKVSSVSAAILTGILILGAAGCDKLKSRDDINKGIGAFKNAKYGDAVELFKEAAALDPAIRTRASIWRPPICRSGFQARNLRKICNSLRWRRTSF